MSGGPNWAGNECDSPVLIDTLHSADAAPSSVGVFFKQPMYYYLGHIAAFAAPNATRLGIRTIASSPLASLQEATAFLTPDGAHVIVVVMNRAGSAHDVAIHVPPHYINVRMAAHSIRTFVARAA